MMTGHSVDARALHPDLRSYHYNIQRGRVVRPAPEMVDAAFDLFLKAIEPLEAAGKLGSILMQYPPAFNALDDALLEDNLAAIDHAKNCLGKRHMLVEFRHPSWVDEKHVRETLNFFIPARHHACCCRCSSVSNAHDSASIRRVNKSHRVCAHARPQP